MLAIVAAGLIVRLALATFAPHPGIADSNHYFNLGRNLADGRGFVIDYIWQYHNPPADVTHPDDYWMPLPAVWAAIGLRAFGGDLFAALLPSVLFGALIPLLAYAIAAAAKLDKPVRLMAMASVVFLPEFVLNSVRTDTTITHVLFVGLATLCFYVGLRQRPPLLLLSGIFAGLAHLTRNDTLLLAPAMLVGLVIFWRFGGQRLPYRWLIALPVGWLIVVAPWLWRNYQLYGELLSSGASRLTFMTYFNDQFTYGRELNLEHWLAWGWRNILSNMAFQALADVKTMYVVLDIGLPITALIGLWGLRRDRERLLLLALPLIYVLALFVYYTVVAPFGTMGGSFKKSYMSLIPYLAMVSAWALVTYVQPRRIAYAVAALMSAFMLLNAIEVVRADFATARRYNDSIADLGIVLNELGDQNDDGRIIVMTQDPYILTYHGFPALMLPSDDRDMILDAARRYDADYILLPADRPALDALYDGVETDPRLPMVGQSGDYQVLAVQQ